MMRFFSYDADGDGFMFHATREEARAVALKALEAERDSANGGEWSDDVEAICWGEIRERVMESSRLEVPEGMTLDEEGIGSDGIDYSTIPHGVDALVDYDLLEVKHVD